jgi:hypothetical protein
MPDDQKNPDRMSLADIAQHTANLRKILDKVQAPELARLLRSLEQHAGDAGLGDKYMPIGLIGDVPVGGSSYIEAPSVQLECRPDYLVVSPDSARFFELLDLKVGKDSQLISSGIIPLDTFSAEYLHNDRLSAIQRWKGADWCSPGLRLSVVVQPTKAMREAREGRMPTASLGPDTLPFRGVLWCQVRGWL